ncbi:MAG: sulfotransferase family protein [Bacteroidota bacterium]
MPQSPEMEQLHRRWRKWLMAPYQSQAAPIFIGGSPRSGTTLMRVIIDSHQQFCCGPESNMLRYLDPIKFQEVTLAWLPKNFDMEHSEVQAMMARSSSLAEFMDIFFKKYRKQRGTKRWADKTPINVHYINFIFHYFPNAHFIHMIRDGRDSISSMRHFPRHKIVNGELVPVDVTNPISQCADTWVKYVEAGLAHRDDDRYHEVKYEQLVREPETTLKKLSSDLDIPFDSNMLEFYRSKAKSRDIKRMPQNPEATQPIFSSSMGRWKDDLSPEELDTVYDIAGELLKKLNYIDVDTDS